MPAFARNSLLAVLLLSVEAAAVASPDGVYMPNAPSGPGGEDVIESSSGARCRQSMNNNSGYLDVGVTAGVSQNRDQNSYYGTVPVAPQTKNEGQAIGYARVSIPLGHRPARLDCSRLYDLEIARMKREIELLKMNAE